MNPCLHPYVAMKGAGGKNVDKVSMVWLQWRENPRENKKE